MKIISGGVTAAKGFRAAGIHAGVKANSGDKKDLALIVSDAECTAAATYTLNRVKAAPLYVTMDHLEDGIARAIVVNSGNANACAPLAHENAEKMCQAAADALGISAEDVVVGSTGVIGQTLNIEAIETAMPALAAALSEDGSQSANQAIMTTDTTEKTVAVEVELEGKTVTIGGIAKGSGMIHPNMGTMLCFVTTDCSITQEMLTDALHEIVPRTFNRITVDGDTSTNDMCVVLANGQAGNPMIEWKDESYNAFYDALYEVLKTLSIQIAADGEGASRLITCTVRNARSEDTAERLARSVVGSSLVKAAVFGADANVGRVLCAMGYSKAPFRPEWVSIEFRSKAGTVTVCRNGECLRFDEDSAKEILTQDEVIIDIDVQEGSEQATCWGCDLTYDYVRINGDYRS
ncbi:MAG: bifunctional glutamate N-acetyltransferase/amino-acid acetyltransferase ArgJ [Oscillospiraceae bacterium]|nr:bifunctional glutamate N-acetyltransferase/amino-acid acetyltransferase ArgJ [Oscillospiraceae bacterium]